MEAELVPDVITLPPEPQRTPGWWRQLSRGDGSRPITREAFLHAFETVAVTLLGVQKASQLEIDLGNDPLLLRDLHEAIQSFGGPQAWQVLLELGGERTLEP